MRRSLIIGAVLLLLVAMGQVPGLLAADGTPHVYVWPEERDVLVGHNGYVELHIDDVHDLYAVQLRVGYDPDYIQILDADTTLGGTQIGAGNVFDGLPWHVDINQVDATTGVVDYIFALDSQAAAGVNGSGVLARIDFHGIQPGASPITWVELVLAHTGGESIEATMTDGRVRIISIPFTATPTVQGYVSPTPTQTPQPMASSTPGGAATVAAPPTATTTLSALSATPVVYIDPAIKHVRPGYTDVVDVRVANVHNLYAAWIRVRYNKSLLEILDRDDALAGIQVEQGDIFAGKGAYILANQVDASAGEITYGVKLPFSETPPPDGGSLARIYFRTLNQGVCPVELIEVILADNAGVSIEAATQNGQVIIQSIIPTWTPTVTPTFTPGGIQPSPTPTQTATPIVAATPLIYLQPDAQALVQGGTADIQVRVKDVTNLYGVELHIAYNPAVLQIVDQDPATAGIQLAYGGFLTPDSVAQNQVDGPGGMIHFAISQFAPTPARNGAGTLAIIRVRGAVQGASPMSFKNTQLLNVLGAPLGHGSAGGFVAVNVRTITGHVLLQGRTQYSGVTIKNGTLQVATTGSDGGFAFASSGAVGDTLNLTASMAGYLPATRALTISSDQIVDLGTTTLIGGDAVGPKVSATRAAGCSGTSPVEVPGLSDSKVNILDLTFVAAQFNIGVGNVRWSPSADGCHPEYLSSRGDINGDLVCNIFDLVQVGNNFGQSGAQPW